MSKFDLWNTIVRSITQTALLRWNAQLVGSIIYPVTSDVEVKFVSSVNPPRYQSKTIMWTLGEVFDVYNEQRHYSDSFMKTQIGRGPSAQNLGVASIKSTLAASANLSTSSLESVLLNRSTLEGELPSPTLDARVPASLNESLDNIKHLSFAPSDPQDPTSIQAGPRGLSFVLNYIDGGEAISDKGFYSLTINLLLFAAQHDAKQSGCGFINAYNPVDNYTYSIGPTSEAARENLSWELAIAVMGYLPSEMLKYGRGGRWAELSGRIKLNNAYIGRLEIAKGDQREGPRASCGADVF